MKWIWQYLKSAGYGRDLPNLGCVDDHLLRGGLPKNYRALEKLGVNRVVNLIEGNQLGEYDDARAMGLDWYHVPMSDREAPDIETVEMALELIRHPRGIAYVHCKGGRHRTGIIVAAYRMTFSAWTFDEVFKEMKGYGWYQELGHKPLLDWLLTFDPKDYQKR